MARPALALLAILASCTPGDDDGSSPGLDGPQGHADAVPGAPDTAPPSDGTGHTAFGIYQSGTRIRMRVGTTPDGAKDFRGWRDTQLNVDCAFGQAADGAVRCLPVTAAFVGVYYADPGCATPLAYGTTCGTTPAYARGSDPCAPAIYPVTGAFAGSVYVKSTTCVAGTRPTGFSFYSLGPATPAATFQVMTESVE